MVGSGHQLHPAVIGRDVVGGRLVRRWDRDDAPLLLNETAALVLDSLALGATREEIVEGLQQSPGAPASGVEAMLAATLADLERRGLVVPVAKVPVAESRPDR